MEGIVKQFFDEKIGQFLDVDRQNLQFNIAQGYMSLRKARFKAGVFEDLHFPVGLKGGYIEEMTMSAPMSLWEESKAQVTVKNVFLIFGPHVSDWTCFDSVFKCKSRLVDVIMKVYELKPPAKKGKPKAQSGFFGDMKGRLIEDIKKKMFGMLEVNISGIHIRYEDQITQPLPFACGGRIGMIRVESSQETQDLRVTGEWRHRSSGPAYADPLFRQSVAMRRISAYWDVDLPLASFFPAGPLEGETVQKRFLKLNAHETFSACVVERILSIFHTEHPRRRYLDGPAFRERLDYHKYVLFPMALHAQIFANKNCEATRFQQAPLKDADVVVSSLEVALDSQQVHSLNLLQSRLKDFNNKDVILRSRPRLRIADVLDKASPGAKPSSMSSFVVSEQRREVVRQWWRHALQSVLLSCAVPRPFLDTASVSAKAKTREQYCSLVMEFLGAADHEKEVIGKKLQEMQMSLPLKEILEWRLLARDRRREHLGVAAPAHEEDPKQEAVQKEPQERMMPKSMQVHFNMVSFNAYFLVVASPQNFLRYIPKVGRLPSKGTRRQRPPIRLLSLSTQVRDIEAEALQKGSADTYIARWCQLSVGSVSVANCQFPNNRYARHIVSMQPLTNLMGRAPACIVASLNMYEPKQARAKVTSNDVLVSLLDPARGPAAHLRKHDANQRAALLSKLSVLEPFKDEVGKLSLFGFVRVGQVRALDFVPYRQHLMGFIKKGKGNPPVFKRRPEPAAVQREMLLKLQRNVQKLTGTSLMMGTFEVILDGVSARSVSHYNRRHMLAKEASLSPMHIKVLRNGKPQTFHMQFHHLQQNGSQKEPGAAPLGLGSMLQGAGGGADSLGSLLPWKATMMLLQASDFQMGAQLFADGPASGQGAQAAPDASNPAGAGAANPANAGGGVGAAGGGGAPGALADPALAVCVATAFLKWGRRGKAKQRFVYYDETLAAIVWKDSRGGEPLGVMPIACVQDVCVGVQTPVLHKVRSDVLRPDKVFSVIAAERTLDLQAESAAQRDTWVAGLKALYKRRMGSGKGASLVPRELERRTRTRASYPLRFRSPSCTLKTQAMVASPVGEGARSAA